MGTMSDPSDQSGRPHQVGMGAWMVIAAAAIHVVGSFDDMSGLRSIETKERAQEALKAMAESGMSVTLDQMLDAMHIGVLVSAAAATAAIVMGIQALKRDRVAPLVLIGLSLLVIGGSLMLDPLMGMFVAAGTGLLWSGPARDWYAGRPIRASRMELAMQSAGNPAAGSGSDREPSAMEGQPGEQPSQQAFPETSQHPGTSQQPPPEPTPAPAPQASPPPYGQPPAYGPPAHPYGQAPVYGAPAHPYGQPAFGQGAQGQPPVGPVPSGRPGSVKAAAIITIVLSSLTALGAGLTMVALLILPRDEVQRAIDEQLATDPRLAEGLPEGVSISDLVAMVGVVLGVFVIWAAIATMLAIMVWRRHNWARALLVASAVVATLVSLLALPLTAVHVLAAIAVVLLLVVPASNAWFRGERGARGPYPGQPGYGMQPGQPGAWQPPTSVPPQSPQASDPRRDDEGKPPVW